MHKLVKCLVTKEGRWQVRLSGVNVRVLTKICMVARLVAGSCMCDDMLELEVDKSFARVEVWM